MLSTRFLMTSFVVIGTASAEVQESDRYYAFQNVFQPEFRQTTQEKDVYNSPNQVNDNAIELAIRNAIHLDDTISDDAKNVLISVENGKVTLTGSVKSRDEKRAVEFDAQSTLGVKRVYNNLEISK